MSNHSADFVRRYNEMKRRLFDRVYENLNAMQREAVTTVSGPLLVLAGAGSGKTTVLVKRIVHIIKYGDAYASSFVPADADEAALLRYEYALTAMTPAEIEEYVLPDFKHSPCPPWAMLAITFTNKAAGEIKRRLAAALGAAEGEKSPADEIWAGTFHSICMRILRRHGELVGLRSGFTVYDTDDAKRVISDCMKTLNVDEKTLPIKTVMNTISRSKDRLLTPEKFAATTGGDFRADKIAGIYRMYQQRLRESNAVDFDDIVLLTVELLRENEDVRDYYRRRFRYVSVDEYQDTNHAQFILTALLTGEHNNLMVVGDDDQSIYRFRGATIENILGFDREYGNVTVIKLEENYRSTKTILNAANAVIANNRDRKGKTLWTAGDKGSKIVVRELPDPNEEAKFILNTIERFVDFGVKYKDFAVLYRTNAQSEPIERAMAKSGMPYRFLSGVRFYDRKEIKDIIAYLCLLVNPDDSVHLKRIINTPKRKIGSTAMSAVEQIAFVEGTSLYNVIKNADNYIALSRTANAFAEFVRVIETLREYAQTTTVGEVVERTIELTGYREMLQASGETERDRLDNIEQLVSSAQEFNKNEDPSLQNFLEEVALVSEVDRYDEDTDAVVLMTIHGSKGLEFPVVFLPGMEDGLFPRSQHIIDNDELEEERRLAYVAITRAKKNLYITYAKRRTIYGETRINRRSCFVKEIPESLLDDTVISSQDVAIHRNISHGFSHNKTSTKTNLDSAAPRFRDGAGVKPASIAAKPSAPAETFKPGDVVLHRTFGRGEVISSKLMGGDTMYEIIFDNVGTKKLMASFAKLKRGE